VASLLLPDLPPGCVPPPTAWTRIRSPPAAALSPSLACSLPPSASLPARTCNHHHSLRPSPLVGALPCPADHAIITTVPSSTCWPKESSRSASNRHRRRRFPRRPPSFPASDSPPFAPLRQSQLHRRVSGEYLVRKGPFLCLGKRPSAAPARPAGKPCGQWERAAQDEADMVLGVAHPAWLLMWWLLSVFWIPGYPGPPAPGPRHRPIFSPGEN
jgi:hypothetical protein